MRACADDGRRKKDCQMFNKGKEYLHFISISYIY